MSALVPTTRLQRYQQNRLELPAGPRQPEPVLLYSLVVLTLASHVPYPKTAVCLHCNVAWPCPEARLAYRLREGF